MKEYPAPTAYPRNDYSVNCFYPSTNAPNPRLSFVNKYLNIESRNDSKKLLHIILGMCGIIKLYEIIG